MADEIKPKDLEISEPIPNLAEYIDRLRKIAQLLKDLKAEIDKIYSELDNLLISLSAMDLER